MDVLEPNPRRHVILPIMHSDVWALYKQAEASFWTAEELDLSADHRDFQTLKEPEQHFILNILAFFAGSDGIVNENLCARFMNEVQIPEARAFYAFQAAMENIHNETYSLLIDALVKDPAAKDELFGAVQTHPTIGAKAAWAMRHIESAASFDERLVAFACVEGVFFSSSFAAIYWLKKRGIMPGTTFSNELISRDEGMHTDFACLLHSKLLPTQKLAPEHIAEIVREAVALEQDFVRSSLPEPILGMNSEEMCKYVEFVADRLARALGLSSNIYCTPNPLLFMEQISLQGKTNFFEKRVSEYAKSNVSGSTQAMGKTHCISFDEEF